MNEVTPLGDLNDPVLLAGFVTHRRAGRIGSRAVAYLVGQWNAKLVARIDSELYTDFTVDRPESRWENDLRVTKWPDTLIYVARPEGAKRDFILLVGFEPSLRWKAFADDLAAFADKAGVRTIVSLRGFAASVPHTRPTPVQMTASDPDLGAQFGIQAPRSRYQGPTDVLGVIAAAGQEKGWQTVDLSVLQPSYYPRMRNAAATKAVVTVLDQAFGTTTAVESLDKWAREQLQTIQEQAPPGDEFRTMVQGLEQLYDEAEGNSEFLAASNSSGLPTGAELVSEVERLLRWQGETDTD